MNKPSTTCILGVNVAITNMHDTVNFILENVEELRGQYVCLTNVHTTVMSYEDKEYRKIQNGAALALPDGSPLSYVQRLRGYQYARQVAGPDLMTAMWKATSGDGRVPLKHYFYGGSQETIDKLTVVLREQYPDMQVVGLESPPFRPLTKEEDEEAIDRINASGADILWIGLGAPKQEQWMRDHVGKVNAIMFGVGAGFDFHSGTVKRAPKWMREHYLEWLFRLSQDPKRLWKRYVNTNGKFVGLLLKHALTGKDKDYDDKKRMLIYAHYYYPDVASTGQILTDLAEGLKDDIKITVICTVPSYGGKIDRYYREHKYYNENINGIDVLRVRVPEFSKDSKLSRIINIVDYFFSAIAATFRVERQDYVYALSQPPVLGGILGLIGSRIKKAKFIYNIQDFNPEQIMAVGYFKNKLLLGGAMIADKNTCRRSDKVIVVGRDMIETLKSRFANDKKHMPRHALINNWIDEKDIYPLSPDDKKVGKLRKHYGLEGKFVIMYSGNIGLYYDLLNIMKVIEQYKDNDKVAFLFAGEGSIKKDLQEYASKKGLSNVVFAPYMEKKYLIYSLNLADVHFVVNSKGIKGVSVPSKLYGVMAAGRPVLGILEKASEARCIIEEAGCGKSVDPGDYKAIKGLIDYYIERQGTEELAVMGNSGREYLEKHLTKQISIEKYKKEILEV